MGDFCHFVSRTFVSPDIWHEMLQRNVWKHEPDLPVGSAIYVKEKEPEKVEKGEIITFTTEQGRTMITHRVAENNKEKHFFVTKGDSNQYQDTKPVKWENLQGTVVFCIPFAGYVLNFTGSRTGKIAAVFFLFAILSGNRNF